jgi:diketogulonate reductase-like aldo/keto reductase
MTKPIVREANGARIPALGLGTWQMNHEDCARAVAHALKTGYRHIDTAAMYGNEKAVGEGVRAAGVPRDEVFVTTKVWRDEIGDGPLQRSAEASLKRLGFDRVDLLLIHWPNDSIPLAQSIAALNDAKRRGLTRHIGVSNFTIAMLAEALRLSQEPIVTNQIEFHPWLDQPKLAAAIREAGLALTAYCPLGRRPERLADPVIGRIAKRIGRTPAQVILRWHIQQPGLIAIPKSANPKRIEENFGVFEFELPEADMAAITALGSAKARVVNVGWAPDWRE